MKGSILWCVRAIFAMCVAGLTASAALAAVFTVDTTADFAVGVCNDDGCSLREAVVAANALPGPDVIQLPAGIYQLWQPGPDDLGLAGDLDILDDLLIRGDHPLSTGVGASLLNRIFDIHPSATVTLQSLSVFEGKSAQGGGIRNRGDLTLEDVIVLNNESTGTGGGVYSEGPLRVDGSSIFSNDAQKGAGIYAADGPLVVLSSTIGSNVAGGEGGGLYGGVAGFPILLDRSLLTANEAGEGGAALMLFPDGPDGPIELTVRNSTVTGNTTSAGSTFPGDISFNNPVSVTFIHSTLVSSTSGLVHASNTVAVGSVKFGNSILRGSCSGGESIFSSLGGNVESTGDTCNLGAADLVGVTEGDLDLQYLMNNGGSTSTHALGASSVAIDFGAGDWCEAQDQRALARDDGACDAGAYEAGASVEVIFADGFEFGGTAFWSSG